MSAQNVSSSMFSSCTWVRYLIIRRYNAFFGECQATGKGRSDYCLVQLLQSLKRVLEKRAPFFNLQKKRRLDHFSYMLSCLQPVWWSDYPLCTRLLSSSSSVFHDLNSRCHSTTSHFSTINHPMVHLSCPSPNPTKASLHLHSPQSLEMCFCPSSATQNPTLVTERQLKQQEMADNCLNVSPVEMFSCPMWRVWYDCLRFLPLNLM